MIDHGKRNVLGVNVNVIDYEGAVERVVSAAHEQRPLGVTALAVHGVMTGTLDEEHRHRLNELELVVPDGQPVRWALNGLHRVRLEERVYGPRLMLEVCREAERQGLPIFLYGGSSEILESLQTNLANKFPGLKIAGKQPSRFRHLSEVEREEVIATIKQCGARIAFVGLGCPRQEVFVYEMRKELSMPLLAVGAAFPFHAGLLAQAPASMQSRGLEWFFRLVKEPRRLWKRYLLLNPLYLTLLFFQMFGVYKIELDGKAPRDSVCPG